MKKHRNTLCANEIISMAKEKYPLRIHVKGYLSPEERERIEAECRVWTPSVYMDGSAQYSIRWDGAEDAGGLR